MRPPRRLLSRPLAIFLGSFLLVAIAPSAHARQENEVRELVNRLAAISPPPAKIDLTVNNLSSLGADDVGAITMQLKSELTARRFRMSAAETADADLTVTLSEGADGYLLVGEIREGANEQVAIFPLLAGTKNPRTTGGVALSSQLLWSQAGEILDFALAPPASGGGNTEMIVLEPRRIVFYTRPQGQWQVDQAIIIPPARPWLRAARGQIDISRGLAAGSAGLPGIECKGDFGRPQTIECGFVSQETQTWIQGDASVPKTLDLGGDVAGVSLNCDGHPVALGTGKEDWTHADSIQAYELGDGGAAASGNAAEFGGPVTSLWATGEAGAARAVVRDLKTGNYEAYVVTATCSR